MNKGELKAEIISQLTKLGNTDQDNIDYTVELYSRINDKVPIKDLIIGINISRDPSKIKSNVTLLRTAIPVGNIHSQILNDHLGEHDLDDGINYITTISDDIIAIDFLF